MRILLLGKDGQVGWELQRALSTLGEVIAIDRNGIQGLSGDLAHPDLLRRTIRTLKPNILVNAAAYTAVDKAESEPDLAGLINGQAPALLAEEMQRLQGWLLHYSTDYVFDGSGNEPWHEGDIPAPLNQYGRTKLEGELGIQSTKCQHLILRTSWVYGQRGNNFARTIFRLALEREQLSIVGDQIGAPTGADLIADVSVHMLRTAVHHPELQGLYHLAAAGEVSWHGYAQYVIDQARERGISLAVQTVAAIPTEAWPTPAQRPHNSRLDTSKLRTCFSLRMPKWQEGVARLMSNVTGNN